MTVSNVIKETCHAIYEKLAQMSMWPEELWNLLNVVGSLGGKYIGIHCAAVSGTKFHNYKGFFSLVLLAVCYARHCFTLTGIGKYGSNNNISVLKNSELGKQFESRAINLPPARTVNGCSFDQVP